MMFKKFLINAALAVIIGIGIIFFGTGAFLRLASEISLWTDWSDPWTTGLFLILITAAAIAFVRGHIEKSR